MTPSEKKETVDEILTAVPGEWRFDPDIAKSFDSHVRKSVPFYDEIQSLVMELSEYFIQDGSRVIDIGCSTGETLYHLAGKHQTKHDIAYLGIEQSPTMIEEARRKLQGINGLTLLEMDARAFDDFDRADLVTALYTLQFLTADARLDLVRRIHRTMKTGGAFLLVEKIHGESAMIEDMWSNLHWDFKKDSGLTDEMILAKARSLRGVLRPRTETENKQMLQEAGFTTIDVFFKWLNWIGIIAIKTDLNPEENA